MAGMAGRAVIIHSLDHALAALGVAQRLKVPLTLLSAPGGAAYLGPGLFHAMAEAARREFPGVPFTAVLDCGPRAGDALAALRQGVKSVRFTGRAEVAAKLAAIAAQLKAEVVVNTLDALDLFGVKDVERCLASWLAAAAPTSPR